MTCHCGNCEDHRVDSWKMFDHDSVQWTEAVLDEVKDELFGNNKTPIVIKSDHPNSLAGYYGKNSEERTKMAEELAAASLEELAWATVDENTEKAHNWIMPKKEVRRQLLTIILTTNEKGDRFVVRIQGEGAKVLYELETGIEPQYLGFVAEDHIIPLRNFCEALGYEVQEIYI